jgi:phenylacetic acid degradation operon negative regulatory protein
MPSLKEEVIILIKEGLLFYLSNPCRFFRIGAQYNPSTFYKTIHRLEQEGLVKKSKKDRKTHLSLTGKGEKFIKKHRAVVSNSPQLWDKKWRLVIFDIPEEKRKLRDFLRRYLTTLGFGKVQRSIWISPYDFGGIIQRYARKLELSDYIYQITADRFKGLSPAVVIETFWDLKGINNQYLELIERYKKKQKELYELVEKDPRQKGVARRVIKEHLLWDYQSILSRAPHLPSEFLPDEWGGEKAREFVESYLEDNRL